jgi:hypothetical protein
VILSERAWRSPAVWAASGALLAIAAFALSRVSLPDDRKATICFVRLTTGLPCPGCGLSRGVAALARGELRRAVEYHPVAPLLAAEVSLIWVLWGGLAFGVFEPPSVRAVNLFLIAHGGILLVVWCVRLYTGMWRVVA